MLKVDFVLIRSYRSANLDIWNISKLYFFSCLLTSRSKANSQGQDQCCISTLCRSHIYLGNVKWTFPWHLWRLLHSTDSLRIIRDQKDKDRSVWFRWKLVEELRPENKIPSGVVLLKTYQAVWLLFKVFCIRNLHFIEQKSRNAV